MGCIHPPHFTSRATIADTLLDACKYKTLHEIIYNIRALLSRTNASTRGSLRLNWNSCFFQIHQFRENKAAEPLARLQTDSRSIRPREKVQVPNLCRPVDTGSVPFLSQVCPDEQLFPRCPNANIV